MKTNEEDKARVACKYFIDLFTTRGCGAFTRTLSGIGIHVTDGMNNFLSSPFTKEEIEATIRGIHSTKVPRPDGMLALFYHRFWHIMGSEASTFYLDILNNGASIKSFNHTNIVLIPKKSLPINMTHFYPISLCNVLLKIVIVTTHFQ